MSNYSLATGSMIQASGSDRYLVNPDRRNFAPRVGLAWTAQPRPA
jgi:hypothetical protein